ncbi:hypothetical protein JAAARDRAFT_32679 [Jaapia argillacea MUCL 33604]|uniref:Uncharacterized protein n=1 Tax=Jaapia argillacea MUCL 33604 TaxID=933084 RepID=A0A067PZZ1_9AGAM|nr:hypothetical protein JAAARDRAFT_32679 [Jaapia argillacea MUCL 33604]
MPYNTRSTSKKNAFVVAYASQAANMTFTTSATGMGMHMRWVYDEADGEEEEVSPVELEPNYTLSSLSTLTPQSSIDEPVTGDLVTTDDRLCTPEPFGANTGLLIPGAPKKLQRTPDRIGGHGIKFWGDVTNESGIQERRIFGADEDGRFVIRRDTEAELEESRRRAVERRDTDDERVFVKYLRELNKGKELNEERMRVACERWIASGEDVPESESEDEDAVMGDGGEGVSEDEESMEEDQVADLVTRVGAQLGPHGTHLIDNDPWHTKETFPHQTSFASKPLGPVPTQLIEDDEWHQQPGASTDTRSCQTLERQSTLQITRPADAGMVTTNALPYMNPQLVQAQKDMIRQTSSQAFWQEGGRPLTRTVTEHVLW